MLAYSSSRPVAGTRSSSPNSILAIIAVHVAAFAVLMSDKMDLPARIDSSPLVVRIIPPEPAPSKPIDRPPPAPTPPPAFTVTATDPLVPLIADPVAIPVPNPLPPLPGVADPMPGTGGGTASSRPIAATPAILLTGAAELKPPYPAAKLASGEEAVLKLRLVIDHSGRVTSVEALGRADPAFLSAARRHILAHWRYRPATTEGHGVSTSLVISLRFQLDD